MLAADPIALSIPVFGLAAVAEWWIAARRGRRDGHHLGTATSDIACGATYQALEVVLRVVVLAAYAQVFEHMRAIDWADGSPWPWVIALLGVDLAYYLWHRISHVVNAMWAVHAVHHQSEDYNLAVALRQPLLEPLTWTPFFCVFALLGVPAELALTSFALNMAYQFGLHTEVLDKLPRAAEWLLNTPSHHRVHHGTEPEYLDKNYGGVLIVWDRLFGTFEPERRRPTYGTTHPLRSYNVLWGNAAHWVRMASLAAAATNWRERVYVLVAHPAWLPTGIVESAVGARHSKYRPSIAPRDRRYVLWSLALIGTGLTVLIGMHAHLSLGQRVVGFGVATTAFVAVTARLERHAWARRVGWGATIAALAFAALVVRT